MKNLDKVNDILKPAEKFDEASKVYSDNVNLYFDNLVKQSKINIDENKETCSAYYTKVNQKNKAEKKNTGRKVLKGFLIAFAVIFFILMVIGIVALVSKWNWPQALSIGFIAGGAVLGIAMILIICLVLNKNIKHGKETITKLEEESNKLQKIAFEQLAALNSSFDWFVPQYLMTESIPLIKLDRVFSSKRYNQLSSKHGYVYDDDNSSVLTVQSGSILGNPFIIEQVFYTWMGQETYFGSLVITWTTVQTDANGHSHTVTHTQTLRASVTKPKPFYNSHTRLVYGNNAAPNLSFTREPTNANAANMSERQLSKFIKKSEKSLDKKAKKTGSFTKMANAEFEALFAASNRDHETEFRLLFTPIAQDNMIKLLKSQPYGDDFIFEKNKTLNIIQSLHSQTFNYQASPSQFIHFDFEQIEKNFKTYCNEYFKCLYFDLAPILSIPLYQQYKDVDYIYKHTDGMAEHEIESIVNYFGPEHFRHPDTVTDCILKSRSSVGKNGLVTSTIDCYSYYTVSHIEYVPVMGGDGHMHDVPVTWYEYIPLKQSTPIKVLDHKGYSISNNNETYEAIYKKFGIKSVCSQKGISLHM